MYTQQPIKSWSNDLSFPIIPRIVLAADEENSPREELEERLRALTEQCDCIQGGLSGCDWDWMWAEMPLLELFSDACPKLPVCLQTFKPLQAPEKTEKVGKYLAELADFSHLLHIPALWEDYTSNLQRFSPALFAENMTLPCRIAESHLDLRQFLQPLLPNASSNLATAVINSPNSQLTLGIPPTQCSLPQKWTRGQGMDINFPLPEFKTGIFFPIEREYETICARTSAFAGWVTDLADSIRKSQRDDDGREVVNRLRAISDIYT